MQKDYSKLSKYLLLTITTLSISLYFINSISGEPFHTQEPPRAGNPYPNLNPSDLAAFNAGKEVFQEVQSVTGVEPGATDPGLGPRFNLNSCAGCHAFPAIGGSSPPTNPQVAVATEFGANNKVPPFITLTGPVREARFKFQSDGVTRDGGVKDLYTITGRRDARQCNIKQPDFRSAIATNNIIFRIPTPLFGLGLIEAIPDQTILDNKNANVNAKKILGIKGKENRVDTLLAMGGHENRSGNDGTITRFGWKAQNKSLEIFAGEAYNVEQGVTNDLFPDERINGENKVDNDRCTFNPTPENHINTAATTPIDALNDVLKFTMYMRFLAPPVPKAPTSGSLHGQQLFVSTGCALCHTPALQTGKSSFVPLNDQTANLYSDLLVHSMGPGLADNIVQGFAGPDDFRTAPLWGLGQRLFYLHDGRTSDLNTAILAHASTNPNCAPTEDRTPDGIACRSEANAVITKYQALNDADTADLIEFLQSL